jgi:hypothetical protein
MNSINAVPTSIPHSPRSTPNNPAAQRSGGSLTIYEQSLPQLLHALNPEAMDSLILRAGRQGQFHQPTRQQTIHQVMTELNQLAKRSLNMRNIPREEPLLGSGQLYFGDTQILSRAEEIRNPINPNQTRGVYSAAVFPREAHPENPVTFITTTPVGGLENLTNTAFRDDIDIDLALATRIQPQVRPSSYQSSPENVLDFERYGRYTP